MARPRKYIHDTGKTVDGLSLHRSTGRFYSVETDGQRTYWGTDKTVAIRDFLTSKNPRRRTTSHRPDPAGPKATHTVSQPVLNVAGGEHRVGLVGPVTITKPVLNSTLAIDRLLRSTAAHSKCLLAQGNSCVTTPWISASTRHFEYFFQTKSTRHACSRTRLPFDVSPLTGLAPVTPTSYPRLAP